jgi:hypothetical protein
MKRASLALVLALTGCNKGTIDLGLGTETDARLTSDAYTWDCQGVDVHWMGVLAFDISLEYVPDNLDARELPAKGTCEAGVSMFAMDTLTGGTDLPGVTTPSWWSTEDWNGRLPRRITGLYYDKVFDNMLTCQPVSEIVSGGIELTDAGTLSGAITPSAGNVFDVSSDADKSAIQFGEEVLITWDATGWDESFVQARREIHGDAVETVTCNTTGLTEFTVDDDLWDLLDPTIDNAISFFYVGFRNAGLVETAGGQKVQTETRALHAIGIQDPV